MIYWESICKLKAIFHPWGRFTSPEGKRFDFIFPELLFGSEVKPDAIPDLADLAGERSGDAVFTGRHRDTEYDRFQIGSQPRRRPEYY